MGVSKAKLDMVEAKCPLNTGKMHPSNQTSLGK